jgi:hypothetical protein
VGAELAQRRETSFTTFTLQGTLEHVFDLRARHSLTDFAKIIGRFDVTSDTKKFARSVALPSRPLIRTPHELHPISSRSIARSCTASSEAN